MEKYTGTSILKKIAIGPMYIYQKRENEVQRKHIEDIEAEIKRFQIAKNMVIDQIKKIYNKVLIEVGEENAAVFEVHMMMIEDNDYLNSIVNIIQNQKLNAEYAVASTGDNFSEMFVQTGDAYMQTKAIDVKEVSERLILALGGNCKQEMKVEGPIILVADDLIPSEMVQFDKNNIIAFVTRKGSANSHTAILSRIMEIPAVFGVDIQEEWAGEYAIVDGYTGEVLIHPDDDILQEKDEKRLEDERKQLLLQELKGKATITKNGKSIHLYANIGSVADVALALQNDAEGIGLFRTESLYLENQEYSSEEKQFQVYKIVAQNMAGKKVVIRTLNVGIDNQTDLFGLEKEENPVFGHQKIWMCSDRMEIFKTQLRAILRASCFGNISIMFPKIDSLQEIHKIKEIFVEVKNTLKQQQIPYQDIEIGVMIETPAAVLCSENLAKEVDFLSIGANDLTQYPLAIDRKISKLDSIYQPDYLEVMRSIQIVIENGHKGGARVGICGELAANTALTEQFVNMGIDELSVSPSFVYLVRDAVRMIKS